MQRAKIARLLIASLVLVSATGMIAEDKARDRGKSFVELPVKDLVSADALETSKSAPSDVPRPAAETGWKNPKVQPGKVTWHRDFDTACQAARKSGKPVLLLQILGNLDDRFC